MHFSKFVLIWTCGLAAWGQGFSAAWDENGNSLISTELTPVGLAASGFPRIYQASAFGMRLVAAGAVTSGAIPDSIVFPRMSARGEAIAYTVKPFVPALHNPPPPPQYRGVARSNGASYEYAGIAGLSANGRWAVFSPSSSGGVDGTVWRDLETGAEKFVAGLTASVDSVADDGSVLSFSQYAGTSNSVRIYRPDGTFRERQIGSTPRGGLLSRDGTTALVRASDEPSSTAVALHVMEVASGVTHLLDAQCSACDLLAISADGSQVLYRDGREPAVPRWVEWRSAQHRNLATRAGELASLQFSDGGKEVYLADRNGGAYRLEMATGKEIVLSPPVPELTEPPTLVAPGGWYRLRGINLSDVEISVNGTILTADSRSDNLQIVRAPMSLPAGKGQWQFSGVKSPFEPRPVAVTAVEQAPRFLRLADLGETLPDWRQVNLAISEVDGSLINSNRPARPGEVIRLWMTGVGRTPAALQWFASQVTSGDRTTPLEALSVEAYPRQEGWWVARIRIPAGLAATGNLYVICDAPPEHPAGDVAVLPVELP